MNDTSSANHAVNRGETPPEGAVMMNAPSNRVEPVTVAGARAKKEVCSNMSPFIHSRFFDTDY